MCQLTRFQYVSKAMYVNAPFERLISQKSIEIQNLNLKIGPSPHVRIYYVYINAPFLERIGLGKLNG